MDNDVYEMCVKLAKRYNDKNHYDDLLSEGYLACMEAQESGNTSDYHTVARRAMSDYMQIKNLTVSVPINGTTRRPDFKEQFNGECSVEDYMVQVDDCVSRVELDDLLKKLKGVLTVKQWDVVRLLHIHNNDTKKVSDELGVSRQAVEKVRNSVREKIKLFS